MNIATVLKIGTYMNSYSVTSVQDGTLSCYKQSVHSNIHILTFYL